MPNYLLPTNGLRKIQNDKKKNNPYSPNSFTNALGGVNTGAYRSTAAIGGTGAGSARLPIPEGDIARNTLSSIFLGGAVPLHMAYQYLWGGMNNPAPAPAPARWLTQNYPYSTNSFYDANGNVNMSVNPASSFGTPFDARQGRGFSMPYDASTPYNFMQDYYKAQQNFADYRNKNYPDQVKTPPNTPPNTPSYFADSKNSAVTSYGGEAGFSSDKWENTKQTFRAYHGRDAKRFWIGQGGGNQGAKQAQTNRPVVSSPVNSISNTALNWRVGAG